MKKNTPKETRKLTRVGLRSISVVLPVEYIEELG